MTYGLLIGIEGTDYEYYECKFYPDLEFVQNILKKEYQTLQKRNIEVIESNENFLKYYDYTLDEINTYKIILPYKIIKDKNCGIN